MVSPGAERRKLERARQLFSAGEDHQRPPWRTALVGRDEIPGSGTVRDPHDEGVGGGFAAPRGADENGVAMAVLRKTSQSGTDAIRRASASSAMIPEPRQAVEPARLVVDRGTDVGAEFALTAERTLLGRRRDCDIVIDDPTVSRQHAELVVRDDQWFVVDGGSLNGTYVNRAPVESAPLRDGDEIWIGKMRFTFRTGDRENRPDRDEERTAVVRLS